MVNGIRLGVCIVHKRYVKLLRPYKCVHVHVRVSVPFFIRNSQKRAYGILYRSVYRRSTQVRSIIAFRQNPRSSLSIALSKAGWQCNERDPKHTWESKAGRTDGA